MAIGYAPPSAQTRLAQPDGTVNRSWYLFFCSLFNSVGGNMPVVPGSPGAVTEATDTLQALSDALTFTPSAPPMLTDSGGVTWRFVFGVGWVVA